MTTRPNAKPYELSAQIVVCGSGENEIGLLVDEVIQIETVVETALHMEDGFRSANLPFTATVHTDGGLALLLSAEQLILMNSAVGNPQAETSTELSVTRVLP